MKNTNQSKNTISVHSGKRDGNAGVVNHVEPSSAFRYLDHGEQLYPRYFNTPNQEIIVEKICALEGAPTGMIFSSGMAAITTTLMSLAGPGDHVVLQNALYGGTHSLVTQEFKPAGIEYTFADCDIPSLLDAIRPNTKFIYVETPANPLLDIVDLNQLASAARSRNICTVVDNTFASPINQNPIAFGIDIVLHSGTKYLGGHSDLSFGAAVGSADLVNRVRRKAVLYGGSVNALTCYLIERSIKTLAIRVQQQNSNALGLAEFLSQHELVEKVYYPGLATHPGHKIATEQMSGFGGMLSFDLIKAVSPQGLLSRLELITPAMSLGGVESTATIPVLTSHKQVPADEREKLGITDKLVRLSVGIESADDLIGDLEQGLKSAERSMSADSRIADHDRVTN